MIFDAGMAFTRLICNLCQLLFNQ